MLRNLATFSVRYKWLVIVTWLLLPGDLEVEPSAGESPHRQRQAESPVAVDHEVRVD